MYVLSIMTQDIQLSWTTNMKNKKKNSTMLLHAHVNDLSHGFGRFVGKSRFSFLSSVHVFISYFRLFILQFIKHILELIM